MMTVCHPHLPILSIWVIVLLNGIKCQENEGVQVALDRMFDDKLAAVENRFNERLEAQAKVTSLKIKEFEWLLNWLDCLKFYLMCWGKMKSSTNCSFTPFADF